MIVVYHAVRFIHLLIKMRKKVVFPVNENEISCVRKHPLKPVSPPTYKKQRFGIILYVVFLLYLLGLLIAALAFNNLAILIISIVIFINFHGLLNMCAIIEDGVIIGSRFVRWKHIKSFQFKQIDMNHRYYGHDKKVNESGYELVIKRRYFVSHCIVVSEEMKDRVSDLLREQGKIEEESLQPQEV